MSKRSNAKEEGEEEGRGRRVTACVWMERRRRRERKECMKGREEKMTRVSWLGSLSNKLHKKLEKILHFILAIFDFIPTFKTKKF